MIDYGKEMDENSKKENNQVNNQTKNIITYPSFPYY